MISLDEVRAHVLDLRRRRVKMIGHRAMLAQALDEIDARDSAITELRRLTQDQAARLRAYAGLMVLRPHRCLAVQGSDEPVLVPEPAALTQIIEERDALEAEVKQLRDMLSGFRK